MKGKNKAYCYLAAYPTPIWLLLDLQATHGHIDISTLFPIGWVQGEVADWTFSPTYFCILSPHIFLHNYPMAIYNVFWEPMDILVLMLLLNFSLEELNKSTLIKATDKDHIVLISNTHKRTKRLWNMSGSCY